jgi:hypothetical protein
MGCEEAASLLDEALADWLLAETQLKQFALLHSRKGRHVPSDASTLCETEKLRKAEQQAFGDWVNALRQWDEAAKRHR